MPYGTRSRETIEKYAEQDCRFLMGGGVKRIIAACGTVSSTAPGVLERLPVPACGVVEPAADAALAASRSGRIGVIGTSATIRSVRRLSAANRGGSARRPGFRRGLPAVRAPGGERLDRAGGRGGPGHCPPLYAAVKGRGDRHPHPGLHPFPTAGPLPVGGTGR